MKKFLCTILATALYTVMLVAQTPVAWYRLDNDFNDYAGTNNGTNAGVFFTLGHFSTGLNQDNRSALFNGSGANINLGAGTALRPTVALTVSAWFNFTNAATGLQGETLISCTENKGYGIFYVKASNELTFYAFRNGTFADAVVNATPYLTGWHHIAGTYDGRYMRLYVDGQLTDTDDAGANYPLEYDNLTDLTIGADYNTGNVLNPNYHWNGKIDEVKIYNTALTGAQIRADADFLAGSGKAINFTGAHYLYSNVVTGINDFATNQDFTIECWFKAPATQTNNSTSINSIINNTDGSTRYNYDIYIYNPPHAQAGKIGIQRWDGTNNPYINSINTVNDDKWHHCAFVRSGGTSGSISLYIDGVLQGTAPDNTGNSLGGYLMKAGGVGCCGYGNFSGSIDEIRIWNTGLTETQLRERMCRKITTADALWNNLGVYYRCDEDDTIGPLSSTGIIVNDSKNAETFNASFQAVTVPHITSGAAIGNTSAFNYAASPSATLSHPQGESMQATVTTGAPVGIHVYGVHETPNTFTGTSNVGSNDRYFGVFLVGGTTPQYTATYNYDGNPNVTPANESGLLLYKRDNNADASWEDCGAVLNTTANTLTATGQHTEYILGGSFSTVPVSLFNFEIQKQQTTTLLKWATAYEQNNRGFEVQHSTDGFNFTVIGFVSGNGNSNSKKDYAFTHDNPAKGNNYYRLRQVDWDSRSSLSKTLLLKFDSRSQVNFYPNPATDVLSIQVPDDIAYLAIIDATGKKLWQRTNNSNRTFMVTIGAFTKGLLLLHTTNNKGTSEVYKIINH